MLTSSTGAGAALVKMNSKLKYCAVPDRSLRTRSGWTRTAMDSESAGAPRPATAAIASTAAVNPLDIDPQSDMAASDEKG
jgi:hypothetical protein